MSYYNWLQRNGNRLALSYDESRFKPLILLVLFGYTILFCLYLIGLVLQAFYGFIKDVINTRPRGLG